MVLIKIKKYFANYSYKNKFQTFWILYFLIIINFSLIGNTFWNKINQTFIQLPTNWQVENPESKIFDFENWKLIIYSKSFSRGEVFYIEILSNSLKDINFQSIKEESHFLYYKTIKKIIPLNKKNFGFNAIYVFPPDIEISLNEIEWKILSSQGEKMKTIQIPIKIRKYPVADNVILLEKKKIPKEKEKEIIERINKEKEVKKIVFSEELPLLIINQLSHPRDFHQITSDWYKKRFIQYFEFQNFKKVFYKPFVNIHKGVDLKGTEGDIVFALSEGKVVLSEEMYYEGNFIVINHGNKIFSGYMHLKEMLVSKNTFIKAGVPIGYVGSTGLSTAPHLHFSLWIDGYSSDPLSILYLPIR